MTLKDTWDYIQNLTTQDFQPFRALARSDADFSSVASRVNDYETLFSLQQKLRALGLVLPDDANNADSYTILAVKAITYRIFQRRGR